MYDALAYLWQTRVDNLHHEVQHYTLPCVRPGVWPDAQGLSGLEFRRRDDARPVPSGVREDAKDGIFLGGRLITTDPASRSDRRTALLWATLLYVLLTVYGSLIPFDFYPRSLDAAWREFLNTRYFHLDLASRADWVANILFYIPMSFLLSAVLTDAGRSGLLRGAGWLFVFAACAALAVGIEFGQIFFPPRTVSLNDIVAELIGTLAGIIVWGAWGRQMLGLWSRLRIGGPGAIRAVFIVYTLVYLVLSLFPYDFVVSAGEFMQKLQSDRYALILVGAGCGHALACGGKLLIEVFAVAPLGFLMGLLAGHSRTVSYPQAALTGLVLGGLIEGAQLFVSSGISQGVSVLTRGAGMLLGLSVQQGRCRALLLTRRHLLRPLLLLGVIPYLGILAWLNGWLSMSWSSLDQAFVRLAQVKWLPFYYHYYTTETAALVSAMAYTAMYVPIGIGCWAWQFARGHTGGTATAAVALGAGLLAAMMEVGKLFLPEKHPDPTDVLIAACAAAIAYLVAYRLFSWSREGGEFGWGNSFERTPNRTSDIQVNGKNRNFPAPVRAFKTTLSRPETWLCTALLVGSALTLLRFPVAPLALAAALGIYFLLLLRDANWWAVVIVALLPALDLAPWSGWLLFGELDIFLLITVAAVVLAPRNDQRAYYPRAGTVLLSLFALAMVVSIAIGLSPWEPYSPDALSTFHTPYNALRVGRGALWGLVLIALARRTPSVQEHFITGMVVGLLLVGMIVLWEAIAFLGPFRFSGDYRVSGSFSAISTAGAQIESYVAAASPFAALWIIRGGWIKRLVGILGLILAAYCVAATVSRLGYVAFAGALTVFCLAWILSWRKHAIVTSVLGAILLALIATGAVYLTSHGSAIVSRLQEAGSDFDNRAKHWHRVWDMIGPDSPSVFLGMGLGSYPRLFYWNAPPEQRPGIFHFEHDQNDTYIRLGVGKAVYVDQFLDIRRDGSYILRAAVRSTAGSNAFHAKVCEKWILYSMRCIDFTEALKQADGWQELSFSIGANRLGSASSRLPRPVKLTIMNQGKGALDITRVKVLDANGRDLVLNGDFSKGGDRWYFSADDHFPWNIFNIFLEVLFEQGWVGLIIFVALLAYTSAKLFQRVLQRDLVAAAHLAALCGFFIPALFDSVIDEPRMRTLLLLLMFLPVLKGNRVFGKNSRRPEALKASGKTVPRTR